MSDELFSHRLRRFREKQGYSQDETGVLLGVTGRYVGMIERGEKDVEPTSAIYKLFGLLENNKVHPSEFSPSSSSGGGNMTLREEPPLYRASAGSSMASAPGLTLPDLMSQIRSDMSLIETGALAEKRRAYLFLTQVQLPCLGKFLKVD